MIEEILVFLQLLVLNTTMFIEVKMVEVPLQLNTLDVLELLVLVQLNSEISETESLVQSLDF